MNQIKIGKRAIGKGNPVYVIAEGCDNHLGSVKIAKEMAMLSKLAGADAIKFQHHLPDEEMLPNVPISSNFNMPLYEFLKHYALTIDQHKEIKEFCEKIDIQYLCTPFSLKAAEELFDMGVDAFKIGSGEMTDIPTLIEIAKMGKPMIISTGMSTFKEIDRTYESLKEYDIPLIFMNCISEYPPNYQDINLRVINQMMMRYPNLIIGHSDHTPDLYTSFAAVTLGAKLIEKHVIINKQQIGPDQQVSIDFLDLYNLIDGITKIEQSMGCHKEVHANEKKIREWAFRSIVAIKEIEKGKIIEGCDIWSKRPGTGIPSHLRNKIIGKRALRHININSLLSWEDIGD